MGGGKWTTGDTGQLQKTNIMEAEGQQQGKKHGDYQETTGHWATAEDYKRQLETTGDYMEICTARDY